jgi:hypothetical protein
MTSARSNIGIATTPTPKTFANWAHKKNKVMAMKKHEPGRSA